MGRPSPALTAVLEAFIAVRLAGRDAVFRALCDVAHVLADIDQGQILWEVYEALQEVDAWWSAN